jgi:transketolase
VTAVQKIQPRAMRDTFLQALYEEMVHDPEIFFVSADFGSPVLDKIRAERPDRFVNVGIAEQNLINVSAGLALEGFKVFAYAIAPFITMRCFEQTRVNLALLSEVRPMNVNLVGVGAGYSYVVSGPTHQCYEDITLMRSMPNMGVLSLSDQLMAAAFPRYCLQNMGPKYLRLDAQVLPPLYEDRLPSLEDGFHVHRAGDAICLVATGYMVHTALKAADQLAAQGINAGVIDLFNLGRFDAEKFDAAVSGYGAIVTMEEGFSGRGGMDAMMFNHIARRKLGIRMLNMGVEGSYRFEIGERASLHEQVGIGMQSVVDKVLGLAREL